jgi:hypothetical protein
MSDLEFELLLSIALIALEASEPNSRHREAAELIRDYLNKRRLSHLKLVVDNEVAS